MPIQSYNISGQVINSTTQQGIANLRVEAWDKDNEYYDLLGSTITNMNGGFDISFDSTYFREDIAEAQPNVFFKVYAGKRLLKSTEEKPIMNAKGQEVVEIMLDMLGKTRPEGKDRISTAQVFQTATFFRESDFKGVYSEFRKKSETSIGFISDMVMNTITKLDIKPVKVAGVREQNILNQDVDSARTNLSYQKVEVNEVLPYNPKINNESFKNIKVLPTTLKPGQRVDLYEENGKVRYYTIVPENRDDSKMIAEQRLQLQKIQEELNQTNQTIGQKDKEIIKLNTELAAMRKEQENIKKEYINSKNENVKLNTELAVMRKDQEEINSVLKSDAFKKLIANINKSGQDVI